MSTTASRCFSVFSRQTWSVIRCGLIRASISLNAIVALLSGAWAYDGNQCLVQERACQNACGEVGLSNEAYNKWWKCWRTCSRSAEVCLANIEAKRKDEEFSRRCSAIPLSRDYYTDAVRRVWMAKKKAFEEHLDTLTKLRKDLVSDYWWTVGDPGSAREAVTFLALVSKTTTDLIEDLSGFATIHEIGAAKDIYNAIKQGQLAHEAIKSDSTTAATLVLLDLQAGVNPAIRVAKTALDFTKNVAEISETRESIERARKEVTNQLEALEKKMIAVRAKIAHVVIADELPPVEALFSRYQSVRSMCELQQSK